MDKFILHSKFKPTGDQPQAIDRLSKGVINGTSRCYRLGKDLHNGEYY